MKNCHNNIKIHENFPKSFILPIAIQLLNKLNFLEQYNIHTITLRYTLYKYAKGPSIIFSIFTSIQRVAMCRSSFYISPPFSPKATIKMLIG